VISKRNKRGVLILAIITLIIIVAPRIFLSFQGDSNLSISSTDVKVTKEDEEVFRSNSKNEWKSKKENPKYFSKYKRPASKFNPNDYSINDWMLLGLSNKQAEIIVKFIHGEAKSNQDLEKIYVLPKALFELIKDSTFYPIHEVIEKERQKNTLLMVELNSADENQLTRINGIGSFYAKQIIKRREMLGGFNQKTQLLEVWKLDSTVYTKIEDQLKIDETLITKFDLNSVTAKELQMHPYINWNVANSIVQLRNQRGGYTKIEEIKSSKLIDDLMYNKIKPYLIVK
jgi:competence protein ComEA